MLLNGKYTQEYLRYCTDYPENQNTARVNNHFHQKDAYASASYTFTPWQWTSVNVGYDARMSWLLADLRNFSTVRRLDQKAVVAVQAEYRKFRFAGSVLYQHYRDHTRTKTGAAEPLQRFTPPSPWAIPGVAFLSVPGTRKSSACPRSTTSTTPK